MPNGRDTSNGRFTTGNTYSGLTKESRDRGREKSNTLKIKWNDKFLQDFVDIWDERPKNDKGMTLKDDNGNAVLVGNGRYALRQLAQKAPDKFVKLGAEVFKALQPKMVQSDIGDNLAGMLENMSTAYRPIIDITPEKKKLEN